MTISDDTRIQRVKRWTDYKSKWESKLEKADNPNDIATAKAMVAEADSALGRLDVLDEQPHDEKKISKRKVTGKEKDEQKTPTIAKNDTSSIGI
jgi:hypothetical protein